ncbi:LysR family transcriptional regulator [uncultured Maritalea sp.]|jgi:DNA-binding transcriptional LysR family regulator|uniref:LysR family transcriptional regulator n=1 Tax=uncultured Maritalea sp. TaxID=757249 RepID=UPI00260DE74C|nr:LysR family transcriptional regulator [uncultured Maritalea sp.]
MRLRHIEIFHTIMVEGSISGAAKVLNISQPAVSTALRHAEDQLGFQLFHRQGKRIVPSHEAKLLFAHTETLMQQVDRVSQICENINEGIGLTIKIGVVPALSFQLLPFALAALRQAFPHIAITANVMRYDAMREALMRKDIDIALSFYGGDIPGMRTHKIGRGRFVVVSQRGRADVKRTPDISLVTKEDFISIADSGPLGKLLDMAKDNASLRASPQLATETYHTAISLVKVGMGITIVDIFSARANAAADIEITETQNMPGYDVSVSFLPNSDKSSLLYAFKEMLTRTALQII